MILCDTGVLLCLIDKKQPAHEKYTAVIDTIKQPLLTTWACLAESMYLALGIGGWPMQEKLFTYLLGGIVVIFDISADDYKRLFTLMEKYQDRPMDIADATLVLAAEQTGIRHILTLDSDFLFYRINNKDIFNIVSAE